MKLFSGYIDAGSMLKQYWCAYGGIKALALSPYFHLSLLFLALSVSWRNGFGWVNDALSVVPSILGFSIGAFAIFLALADEKFVNVLTMKNLGPATSKTSAHLKISALFIHFMIIQVLAILIALSSRSIENLEQMNLLAKFVSGTGYFFFIYSIFTAVAVSLNLLRLALLFNKFKVSQDEANN